MYRNVIHPIRNFSIKNAFKFIFSYNEIETFRINKLGFHHCLQIVFQETEGYLTEWNISCLSSTLYKLTQFFLFFLHPMGYNS